MFVSKDTNLIVENLRTQLVILICYIEMYQCNFTSFSAEEVKDESSYSFSGDGYAVLRHDSASAYNKYLFSMSLSFRTFDANALLFIGVGNDKVNFF